MPLPVYEIAQTNSFPDEQAVSILVACSTIAMSPR